ncbi:MAG: hypothetical protein WD597_00230 [Balneolaceae bacterium]
MDNLPRIIINASGVVVLSAAFIIFTSELLRMVNAPSWTGTLFLIFYGFVYFNFVFASSRRFMRRLNGSSSTPYVFGILIALPPLVWVNIYDAGLGESMAYFIVVIVIGCGLGAYFGHRAGLKAQITFKENLQKHLDQDNDL